MSNAISPRIGDAQAPQREAFVASFFDELARCGVRHLCVSPGSRSAPLAVAAHRQPGLRCWSHLDERSAAFFGLGLAKRTGRPVALVCTSGTAAANYLPAILESHHSGVPLLVLTADRPPELREWGAGQTVDQIKLYGDSLRWFVELPVLDGIGPAGSTAAPSLDYARSLACRAVAECSGPWPGPVHLNWPLREPLHPAEAQGPASASPRDVDRVGGSDFPAQAFVRVERPAASLDAAPLARLVELAESCERGLVVCGPRDASSHPPAADAELARATGWPVFADATSQLRRGAYVDGAPILGHGDLLLRDPGFAEAHRAGCVLRLGGSPVSKAYRLWLESHPPEQLVVVSRGGEWSEPSHLASSVLRVDPGALCRSWADALGTRGLARRSGGWTQSWLDAERRAAAALADTLAAEGVLFAPRAVRELCDTLPEGASLYVANSMAVRYLDAFLSVSSAALRVLSNRGANGIDGTVSSALGAAVGGAGPTVLLTGDLAFLHDIGGLLAARRYGIDLTIVVLNDDGGGIFSHLPIAALGARVGFEALFETPHGLVLSDLVKGFDLGFARVDSCEHLRAAVKEAAAEGGCWVIEVPVDRKANAAHFRSVVGEASRAAARAPEAKT